MSASSTPRQISKKLSENSKKAEYSPIQQDLRDGAETIDYLLILLKECADYIDAVKEYDKPPRFIIAVREALS